MFTSEFKEKYDRIVLAETLPARLREIESLINDIAAQMSREHAESQTGSVLSKEDFADQIKRILIRRWNKQGIRDIIE